MRQFPSWKRITVSFAGLLLIVAVVTYLPRLIYPSLSLQDLRGVADAGSQITMQNARYQLQNDFRGELLQTLAALFVVGGAVATWQQIRIARDGQLTERFTKAIDQLVLQP